MDVQSIAAIIFLVILGIILYVERKKLQVEKILFPILYFVMYRTKWGIASMDAAGKKYKKALTIIGYIAIVVGFVGMAFMIYMLFLNLYNMFFIPGAVSGVSPVLPVKAKGVFYVPFFYWIISIFIIAVVHEYSHGIIARTHDIKIKSSGLAFLCALLPIIPAAFVEPDENELKKKSRAAQLSVFAAGPFSNIVLGFVFLGLLLSMAPMLNGMSLENGVEVVGVLKDANGIKPAELAGLSEGVLITGINTDNIKTAEEFQSALGKYKAGDTVTIHSSDNQDYQVALGAKPGDTGKPYLGVNIKPSTETNPEVIQKYGTVWPQVILWIAGLFYLLIILNLGIGLFNLVPLGPIDGGRMLLVGLGGIMEPKKAELTWKIVSYLFLVLIVVSLVFSFIK